MALNALHTGNRRIAKCSVRIINTPGRAAPNRDSGSPIDVKIALLGPQINHVKQAATL